MIGIMKPGIEIFYALDKLYIAMQRLMKMITRNDGFQMPIFKFSFSIALLIGKGFDLLAKIQKKDLPINSDRIKYANIKKFREKFSLQTCLEFW